MAALGLIDSLLQKQKAAAPNAQGVAGAKAGRPKEKTMVDEAWEREFAAREVELEMERERREQEILAWSPEHERGVKQAELKALLLRFSSLSSEAERVVKGKTTISKQQAEVRPPLPVTTPMTLVDTVMHRRKLRERVPVENQSEPAYRHEQFLQLMTEGELAQMGVHLLNSKANVQSILHAYQDLSRKAILDELAEWGTTHVPHVDPEVADLGGEVEEAVEAVRSAEIDDDVQKCEVVDQLLENARVEQEERVERTKGFAKDLQQLTGTISDLRRQQEELERPLVDAATNTSWSFGPSETVFMTNAPPQEDSPDDRQVSAPEALLGVSDAPPTFTSQPLMDWLVKSDAGLDRLYELCMSSEYGMLRRQDAAFHTHLLRDKNDRMTRQRIREERTQAKLRHLIMKLREQLLLVRQELHEARSNNFALGFTEDDAEEIPEQPEPEDSTSTLVETLKAEMADAQEQNAVLLAQARDETQKLRTKYVQLCQDLADSEKRRVVLMRENEEAKVQLKLMTGSLESRDMMLRDNESRSRATLQRMESLQQEEDKHQKTIEELQALIRVTRQQMSTMLSEADVETKLASAEQQHLKEVHTLAMQLNVQKTLVQEMTAARASLETRFRALEDELESRDEGPSAESFNAIAGTLVSVCRQQAEVLANMRQSIIREVPDVTTCVFEASTSGVRGLVSSLKGFSALETTPHQHDLRAIVADLQRESSKLYIASRSSPPSVILQSEESLTASEVKAKRPVEDEDGAQEESEDGHAEVDDSLAGEPSEVLPVDATDGLDRARIHAVGQFLRSLMDRWNAHVQQVLEGNFGLSTNLELLIDKTDKAHPLHEEMRKLELLSHDLFRLVMQMHRRGEVVRSTLVDVLRREESDQGERIKAQDLAVQRSLSLLHDLEAVLQPAEPPQPPVWPRLAWRAAIQRSIPSKPLALLSLSTGGPEEQTTDLVSQLRALRMGRVRQDAATAVHSLVLDTLELTVTNHLESLVAPVDPSPVPPLGALPSPVADPLPTPKPRPSSASARSKPSEAAKAGSPQRSPRTPSEGVPRRPPSASAPRNGPPSARTAPRATEDKAINTAPMVHAPQGDTQEVRSQVMALQEALKAREEQIQQLTSRQSHNVSTDTHEARRSAAVPLAAVAAAYAVLAAQKYTAVALQQTSSRNDTVQLAIRKMGHAYDAAQLTLTAMDQLLRCVQPEGQPELHVLLRRGADFMGSARRVVDDAGAPNHDASLRTALQSLTAILPGCRLRLVTDDARATAVPAPDPPVAPSSGPHTPPRAVRPPSPSLQLVGALPKAVGELLRLKGQSVAGDTPRKTTVITLPRVSMTNDLWQNPLQGGLFWHPLPTPEPGPAERGRCVLPTVSPPGEPPAVAAGDRSPIQEGKLRTTSPQRSAAARPMSGLVTKLPPSPGPGGSPNPQRHGAPKPLPRVNRVILPVPSPADDL